MELQSILTADYLDIIFDNRNKAYGGYELRKHYNRRAMKSITLVVSAALLLLGVHAFASKSEVTTRVELPTCWGGHEFEDLTPDVPDPPPVPVAPPPAPPAPSLVWTPPVIVEDLEVPEPPPTQIDLKDKVISTVKSDGDPNGSDLTIPTNGSGNGDNTGLVEKPAGREDVIVDYVSQMPEFNGNVSEYLGRNIQYPQMSRETQTTGRVIIKFVINEDGTVSGARVLKGIGAGCEEEAIRVINSMPKWKPGRNNGKAVKVYMTLPVKFQMN